MKKLLLTLMVTLCLLMGLCVISANAETYTGICGDNATYVFDDETRTLTISGTGAIYDYTNNSYNEYAPWRIEGYYFEKLVIDDGITRIGSCAFNSCTRLKEVDIADSVISIGQYAFENTKILNDSGTYVGNYLIDVGYYYNKTYQVAEGTIAIADNAFENDYYIETVELPSSLKAIGAFAFNMSKVKVINLPDNLEYIGERAFQSTGITEVIMPDTVTYLGEYAFYLCGGINNLKISNSLKSIGDYTFANCSRITNIQIPDSVETIGSHAFDYCQGATSIKISKNVTFIGEGAFSNCQKVETITIPDSVKTIKKSAFAGCKALTEVKIGADVTSLGELAFSSCTSLANINIGTKITSIGANAFQNTAYYNDTNNWKNNLLYVGK